MKKFAIAMSLVVASLVSTACSTDNAKQKIDEMQQQATTTAEETTETTPEDADTKLEKIPEEKVYHNAYFGVEITMPKGWFIEELVSDNLSEDPSGADQLDNLAIYEMDNIIDATFMEITNIQDELSDNHVAWTSYAQQWETKDYEKVSTYVKDYMLEETTEENVDTFKLVDEGTKEINGVTYQYMSFVSQREQDNYYEDFYIKEVDNGYIFNEFLYWDNSNLAKKQIEKCLKDYVVFK